MDSFPLNISLPNVSVRTHLVGTVIMAGAVVADAGSPPTQKFQDTLTEVFGKDRKQLCVCIRTPDDAMAIDIMLRLMLDSATDVPAPGRMENWQPSAEAFCKRLTLALRSIPHKIASDDVKRWKKEDKQDVFDGFDPADFDASVLDA